MGSMRVKTRKIPPVELDEKQRYSLLCTDEYAEHVSESPFLYLTCDLPPPPLFKDEVMENIIPQVKKKKKTINKSNIVQVENVFKYSNYLGEFILPTDQVQQRVRKRIQNLQGKLHETF